MQAADRCAALTLRCAQALVNSESWERIMKLLSGLLVAAAWFVQSAAAGDKTTVTLDGLKSDAPTGWKMQEPANKFRAYQFVLPKATGDKEDGELVIFYFGAGGGGSPGDNLKRWKGMFEPPQGKT